jgi:hypothetical protein
VVLNFWRFHPVPSINSRATLNPRCGEQIVFGVIGMVAVTLRCTPARRLRVRSSGAVAVCGGRERRAQRRYRPRRHSLVAARLCITPPLAALRRPREEHQRRWAGSGAIALILLLFDAACAKWRAFEEGCLKPRATKMACGKLLDTAEFGPVEDCSRLRSGTAEIAALQVNNFDLTFSND